MKHLIDCAMGRCPCDLVIGNVRIFNVFTGETEAEEIAVADGRIVAVGRGFAALRRYDGRGRIALPSFLDSHIHVESSMLSPEAFAELCVAHGTGAVVADPHEIVNVCGVEGAEYLAEAFSRLRVGETVPLDVRMQLPSCVPATPFETSGAALDARETARELETDRYSGLGEMMNFPAVIGGDGEALGKTAAALSLGKIVDGHAPGVSGRELCAYLCGGARTDHEATSAAECREKAARGMYVQLRCGSSADACGFAKDAVDGYNFRRFLICSDDKNAAHLSARGHIDDALRRLVASGVEARHAIAAATINAAECYGIEGVGAIAPRYFADICLVDDLESFRVRAVFKRGTLVAEDGKALFSPDARYLPDAVRNTVHVKEPGADAFRIVGHGGKFRVMEVVPGGLGTRALFVPAPCGEFSAKGTDLAKLAVVERHFATGRMGVGLVKGYGFHGGAMGISVAHDSHNLVVLGDDDAAMLHVVTLLREAGGGMALVSAEGEEIFPLDIAGLMSSAPAEEVVSRTRALADRARAMGVKDCYEPFMTLAFLSLAVIPELRLLDGGVFDLRSYSFVPLEER